MQAETAQRAVFILSIPQLVGEQGLNGIHPGGVNICEHLEVLGEACREERVKCTALTAGHFRVTLSEFPVFSTRETSLTRPALSTSKP